MPVDPVTGEQTPYAEGEMQALAGGESGEIPPELLQLFGGMQGPEDPAAMVAQIGEMLGSQLSEAHAQLDAEAQQMFDMLHQVLDQSGIQAATMGTPGMDIGVAGGQPFAGGGPAPPGDQGINLEGLLGAQPPAQGALPPELAQGPVDPSLIGG